MVEAAGIEETTIGLVVIKKTTCITENTCFMGDGAMSHLSHKRSGFSGGFDRFLPDNKRNANPAPSIMLVSVYVLLLAHLA